MDQYDDDRCGTWQGAVAGAFAAFIGLAFIVVLREITGIVSLLDALAEVILSWIPLGLFSALLRIFGTSAKAWLFVGVVAMLVLIGAGIGVLLSGSAGRTRRVAWGRGPRLGGVTLVVLSLVMVWAVDLHVGGVLPYSRLIEILLCVAGERSRSASPFRSPFGSFADSLRRPPPIGRHPVMATEAKRQVVERHDVHSPAARVLPPSRHVQDRPAESSLLSSVLWL